MIRQALLLMLILLKIRSKKQGGGFYTPLLFLFIRRFHHLLGLILFTDTNGNINTLEAGDNKLEYEEFEDDFIIVKIPVHFMKDDQDIENLATQLQETFKDKKVLLIPEGLQLKLAKLRNAVPNSSCLGCRYDSTFDPTCLTCKRFWEHEQKQVKTALEISKDNYKQINGG